MIVFRETNLIDINLITFERIPQQIVQFNVKGVVSEVPETINQLQLFGISKQISFWWLRINNGQQKQMLVDV